MIIAPRCQSAEQRPRVGAARPIFQMRLVLDAPSADSEQMTMAVTTQNRDNSHTYTEVFNVQKTVLLDQAALLSANASTNALGLPVIEINFTEPGAKRFAEVTRQNLRKRLAIIMDGRLYEAPVILNEIQGGKAQISGSFSKQEARDLATKITASLKE